MIPPDVAGLIREIIRVDCTTIGHLRSGEGEFCVIGGLYACIDPDWATSSVRAGTIPETNTLRRKIEDALGLERGALIGAYHVNDRYGVVSERRTALCRWVDKHTEAVGQET